MPRITMGLLMMATLLISAGFGETGSLSRVPAAPAQRRWTVALGLAAGLACAGRLDGRVERQNVGLFRDVRDQFGDFADFLRRLAQALDPLGCFLDLVADRVHAANGVLHRLQPGLGSLQGLPRNFG